MDKHELKSFFDESYKVQEALENLPYRDAAPALEALKQMQDIIGEAELPGGYYGCCMGCDEIKGHDEMVNCGHEDLCRDCADGLEQSKAATA